MGSLAGGSTDPLRHAAARRILLQAAMTDDRGEIEVKLPAPDFAGELRLVAIAATREALGAGRSAVIVRPTSSCGAPSAFLAPAMRRWSRSSSSTT